MVIRRAAVIEDGAPSATPPATPPVSSSSQRMRSLDGLRGLAAVVVVLGHVRLILLEAAHPVSVAGIPVLGQASELLGVWGAEAVWLFFVLSGLVLSRLMLRSASFDYGNYVLGRLARLYLPVIAAVIFTAVTMVFVGRNTSGLGPWVDAHPKNVTSSALVADLTLIGGTSGNLSPLWSLQWEVLFSLLLILYVFVLKKVPPVVGIVASIALSVIGQRVASPVLMYMSMFAIGTSLALAWDGIERSRTRMATTFRRLRPVWFLGLLVALALIVGLQELPIMIDLSKLPSTMTMISMSGSLIALTATIILVGMAQPLKWLFESRVLQWFGAISFSLYLIHEPVLLVFVHIFRADPLAVVIGLVLCFPIAHLFYRAVEKPSHTFSRRFSRTKAESVPPLVATPVIGAEPSLSSPDAP